MTKKKHIDLPVSDEEYAWRAFIIACESKAYAKTLPDVNDLEIAANAVHVLKDDGYGIGVLLEDFLDLIKQWKRFAKHYDLSKIAILLEFGYSLDELYAMGFIDTPFKLKLDEICSKMKRLSMQLKTAGEEWLSKPESKLGLKLRCRRREEKVKTMHKKAMWKKRIGIAACIALGLGAVIGLMCINAIAGKERAETIARYAELVNT